MKNISNITKKDLQTIESLYNRLCKVTDYFFENDYQLNIEDTTISEQLNIAVASFCQILQELDD